MKKILFKNAAVFPITSEMLPKGDVLVVGNKIEDVRSSIELTEEMEVINCEGLFLFPGFIDVHTHLGLYDEGTGWAGNDANETIEPLTPISEHLTAFIRLIQGSLMQLNMASQPFTLCLEV